MYARDNTQRAVLRGVMIRSQGGVKHEAEKGRRFDALGQGCTEERFKSFVEGSVGCARVVRVRWCSLGPETSKNELVGVEMRTGVGYGAGKRRIQDQFSRL